MSNLPPRYRERWDAPFEDRVNLALRPGLTILDVGAGRRPTIPPSRRPPNSIYVGLDLSSEELAAAPEGSYDEVWVADATRLIPDLRDRFDLIVSWQVLEHVRPFGGALANFHAYLRPGGRFIAQFSGTFSFFGLINRVIPDRLTAFLVDRFTERRADAVFPAHYDRCWDSALRRLLHEWSTAEIVPRYTGAAYLRFLPPLQRLYLVYENWAMRAGHRDLATHYIVEATR